MTHSSSNVCLPCITSSHFLWEKGYSNSYILLKIWELFPVEITLCWPCQGYRCCKKLFQSFSYMEGMLWNTWSALDVSPCHSESHFSCREGALKLIFCITCVSYFWQKWHRVDYIKVVYSVSSTWNHPCITLRKVMRHSSGNGCFSLWHILIFPRGEGTWNMRFCMNKFQSCSWQNWHDEDHESPWGSCRCC